MLPDRLPACLPYCIINLFHAIIHELDLISGKKFNYKHFLILIIQIKFEHQIRGKQETSSIAFGI